MSLKRYLLIVYLLSLGGLLIIGTAVNGRQGLAGMLILAPLIALANTFVNVWPWAQRIPIERRTSYRAYKVTNIFMGIWLLIVAAIAVISICQTLFR